MTPARRATPALPAAFGSSVLEEWMAARGERPYRARQVRRRLWAGDSFSDMLELPAALRGDLETAFRPLPVLELRSVEADQGLTTKFLYLLDGGYTVESVVMRYPRRATLCISSQVGCPIGCPFCATGQGPFGRNLTSSEIVGQAVAAARLLRREGRRLTHVVFMGMGEPLANLEAVLESVRLMTAADGLGLSQRRITISTAGLVPRIERLAQDSSPLTLAVSLHAARDELRDVLVPINRRYPLRELMAATRRYASATGRRVSFEWVLLAGVNDTDTDAAEAAGLIRGQGAHLNLIPFNPVDGSPYAEPSAERIQRFTATLRRQGVNVTLRDTRGRESSAACGQLRQRSIDSGLIRA